MAKLPGVSKAITEEVYFTPEGLEEVKSELSYLKTSKRNEVAERIQKAREIGDVDENVEYDAALEEQNIVESRIVYLEEALNRAKVIKTTVKSSFVVIGSVVIVEIDGEVDEFTIVGKMEADPVHKKISNESPLGQALLGAKVGEVVEVTTPIVRYRCKVMTIK